MLQVLKFLNDFVHEAQRERGLTSLFLHGKDNDFFEKLEAQFVVLDSLIYQMQNLPLTKIAHVESFLNAFEYLKTKRKSVIDRHISPADAIAFYSRDIIVPAINIIHEVAVMEKSFDPARVAALANFLHWKERVGIERALGTQFIGIELDSSAEIQARLGYLVEEQQAYERMFMALADSQFRLAVENLEKNNLIFRKIETINKNLANGANGALLSSLSVTEWFNLITAKMDILHELGKNLIGNLENSNTELSFQISITPRILDLKIDANIRNNLDKIRTLPLFSGLDETSFLDIMKHGRIVSHNKGSMIFIQGEQANRFFVVLEGWVKLFKGDIDGHESVLQMLSSGAALLETNLFSEAPYRVSAQAVQTTKLLSIPSSLIRDKMKSNQYLMTNLIATIAGKSENLISQFEQLTLKSVSQRLGWFLLGLYLDAGEKNNKLFLPYDKSLIAGFLGMKPETFSRTMQALRETGIKSEGNFVTIENASRLCDYCDFDMQEKCKRKGTSACKKAYCMVN
jgi:CRP-like cAMP-binding protein